MNKAALLIVTLVSPARGQLMDRALADAGFEFVLAPIDCEMAFLDRLAVPPDLVVTDLAGGPVGGQRALALISEHAPRVPLIVLADPVDELIAIEVMRQGASAYVMTDRMRRLVPSIERAMRERAATEALRVSERRLAEAERVAHIGYWEWDINEQDVVWSDETCRVFGQPQRPRKLAEVMEYFHPDDHADVFEAVTTALQGGARYDIETRIVQPDGTVRLVHAQGDAIRDGAGKPVRMFGTIQDITERKRFEAALRQSEIRLRDTVAITPNVAVQWYDEAGRVTYWNPASERMFGWLAEEAVGKTLDHTIHTPEGAAEFLDLLRMIQETGQPAGPAEYEFSRRDGSRGVCLSTTFEIPSADGQRCFVCMDVDITERKRMEAELRASEERFAATFQLSPAAISISRVSDGVFVDVNDAWLNIMNRSRDDVIGRTAPQAGLVDSAAPWDRNGFIRPFEAAGWRRAHRIDMPRLSGPPFVGLAAIREISIADEPHYLATMQDITELEQAQQALRESEQRFRQVTESIQEVFWLIDLARREVIYISPAYEQVWGRPVSAVGGSSATWFDSLHPDDKPVVARKAAAMAETGEYDVEYRVIRPDGGLRWVHDRAYPIRDEHGRVFRIAGVAQDITARRHLEEQFRQAQKMEAVGQLAGGVAHDFNNLLAVIQIQASMLLADGDLAPHAKDGIQEILAASERAGDLTRQLLTFSRRGIAQARVIDLAEIIGNVTRMLRRILGGNIVLETALDAVPPVRADPGMMEQVLMNLAVNARDAMPNGGVLRIGLTSRDFGQEGKPVHVCLSVQDTGIGIQPENLRRIFEPFFTTKDIGKGSGLGLSTVFGIVEQHGGWIDVASETGQGALFSVFIPASPDDRSTTADRRGAVAPNGGTETVLLVEDDPVLRGLARTVLRRYGYTVIEADTAQAALEAMAASPAVDLLLTDLMMPGGMSGRDLVKALEGRFPGMRVLYTSGYGADLLDGIDNGRNFLPKPYRIAMLAEKVRQCLDDG